jgi:hypothetical protein
VAIRLWILSVLVAMVSILAGCGGGSSFNVQNPPAPPPSKTSIAFQTAPAGLILINATTNLTAVVSNDSSSAGVDWMLTCASSANCGSLSTRHTSSGQTTTYTPPSTLSGNSQNVTIVAFATADHTQNVIAPITISAFGSALRGTYVLQAQGLDSSFLPYQFAGVIVLDGNGGILSGEQTVNFNDPVTGLFMSKTDSIYKVASSYFIGADGRGTITLNPANDTDIGLETFNLVGLSSSQALISVQPTSGLAISGTGTMDLQTWTANSPSPSAGYAFVVNGTDFSTASPVTIGGVFNIDSIANNPNNISGKGSISDQNLAGTVIANQALSGTISSPDQLGAVTLNLTVPNFSTPTLAFTGYLVDSTHVTLIESDNGSGAGVGSTAGVAISQGSATGTFIDDTFFSGTYVYGVNGVDLTAFLPSTATSVGVFSADGGGNLTSGYTDTLLQLGPQATGTQISASFVGKYFTDPHGTGRVRATFNGFVPPPIPGFSPVFFMYLTGNGNPPLVMVGPGLNYPFLGAGIAYPQSTGPLTFSGPYGFNITQQNGSESDGNGQMTANKTTDTLSGIVDFNSNFNQTSGNSLSGTFASPGANGRFAGTLASGVFDFSPMAADFFLIDSGHGFFVETDLINPTNPSGVVSSGYFATRTPVCPDCP